MAESILHFGAVTFRVNGTGNMQLSLIGLDDAKTFTFVPLPMVLTPGKEPTKLANFNQQRARLRMETNTIDEYMKVNRVVLWVRELYTSFPNGGV